MRTELVSLIDLGPTMLAAVGLDVLEQIHGQPLFDAQCRPATTHRQYVFGHRDRMDETEITMRAARDERFRYIRNYHPDRPYAQHLDYVEGMPTWRELRRLCFEGMTIRGRGEMPILLTPAHASSSSRPSRPRSCTFSGTIRMR